MKLTTSTLLASLALTQAVTAVPQQSVYGSPSNTNHARFPLLTKLRDGAIEAIFGRHPTKVTTNQSPSIDNLRAQYSNELVLRFNVTTTEEETALSDATARLFLDVWAFTEDYVDVRIHADEVSSLLSLLPKSLHLSHSTLINDLAAAIHRSLPTNGNDNRITSERIYGDLAAPHGGTDNIFFQDYQPLDVIVRWMRLLEAMFPSYVEFITIGKSWEGRDIPALRVGVQVPDHSSSRRKTIVVTGGLHGREWISTSTVNYLAWSFITSFGKEPIITKLVEEFDIVFMPVVNPDGVEYTWQVDRLWRKSRQQTNLRYCRGLDLDHAFGYEWDGADTQSDPCSETYGGEEPFQAIEAQALANWARNQTLHNVNFVALMDLHSYSQQILFPYAYTCDIEPPNIENLTELAAGLAKSIRLTSGESYSVTSACEGAVSSGKSGRKASQQRIESGGGSAIDWFYHEMRAHFSYQVKLRDTGAYGFLLPREHIVPTGEEIFHAMKYFGDYLLGNNGIEKFNKDEGLVNAMESNELENDDAEKMTGQELRRRTMRR